MLWNHSLWGNLRRRNYLSSWLYLRNISCSRSYLCLWILYNRSSILNYLRLLDHCRSCCWLYYWLLHYLGSRLWSWNYLRIKHRPILSCLGLCYYLRGLSHWDIIWLLLYILCLYILYVLNTLLDRLYILLILLDLLDLLLNWLLVHHLFLYCLIFYSLFLSFLWNILHNCPFLWNIINIFISINIWYVFSLVFNSLIFLYFSMMRNHFGLLHGLILNVWSFIRDILYPTLSFLRGLLLYSCAIKLTGRLRYSNLLRNHLCLWNELLLNCRCLRHHIELRTRHYLNRCLILNLLSRDL